MKFDIAIIGGGAAGVMSLNRAYLNNDSCIFFAGTAKHKKRSRALWVKKVENVPSLLSYSRGVDQPNKEMIDWIKNKNSEKIVLKLGHGVDHLKWLEEEKIFELIDSKGETYHARFVVLATGIMDVQPSIAGSIIPILPHANQQTVDYCLRCDGHHAKEKKTGVVGNTKAAAWVAIMLYERYTPPEMTIFTNGGSVEWSETEQVLLDLYKIKIEKGNIQSVVESIEKKLIGLSVFDPNKSDKWILSIDILFVSLGVIVYNELAKEIGVNLDSTGYVITDENGQSSFSGLYAVGDLRAGKKKQIYTAWDTAVDSLDRINLLLRLEKREALLQIKNK